MKPVYVYRIVETLDPRRPGERWFEVWYEFVMSGPWPVIKLDDRF